METKAKKLGPPPDKLYFCQTDESLSVHHYAIDKPENKRVFSIYPDANKVTLSNPRLLHASNSSLKDFDSISSLLKPEQKYSALSRDSLRRQLDYVSTSTTSQGSEGKKIRADVPQSNKNVFKRKSLNEGAISSTKEQTRRLSAPEELLGQKTAQIVNGQNDKNALNPAVQSATSIVEKGTPKSSATIMTKPTKTKTIKSEKIFSSYPRDQTVESNSKGTVNEIATTKPVEKKKPVQPQTKIDQIEMKPDKQAAQTEDRNRKRRPTSEQTMKQDSTKPTTQAPTKHLQSDLNQLQFGLDQNADDSLTMLTKACEILIENTFSTKQSNQKKPGTANKYQTKQDQGQKPALVLPTKPQMALSNLIDKMFNIQPQEKFSSRNNRDSVKSSPTSQANLVPPEPPMLSKEFPTKKKVFDGASKTATLESKWEPFSYTENKSKKGEIITNQDARHTIHQIYTAQADEMPSFENDERFSYSNSQYRTKPGSQKMNRKEFSKPRSYYSDSDENDFTHSDYSDEADRYYFSDKTEGSIFPSEGDVKQPQKFRTISKGGRRSDRYSDKQQSFYPSYSHSEKFSQKHKTYGQEKGKSYFKKLYNYTSDKLKRIVQVKPEEEYFPGEERVIQSRKIAAARLKSQRQFVTQNVQKLKETSAQPLPQSGEASSVKSVSKRMATKNTDTASNRSVAFQIKSVAKQSSDRTQSVDAVNTQTESLSPVPLKKHTVIYEDKFTSTDSDEKSFVDQLDNDKLKSTEIQTQTERTRQINKQTKKTSANRTKSPARSNRSQKVPSKRSDANELNSDRTESNSTDTESSIGQVDHTYEQPDKDPSSRRMRDGNKKGLSTRDKYLKKLYQYLPGSTKKSADNHPIHGLHQKRKTNRKQEMYQRESNGQKAKTRTRTERMSDVSEGWQSDQNYSDMSDGENSQLYSYFSDSNLSDQSLSQRRNKKSHKQTRKQKKLREDDEIASVKQNNNPKIKRSHKSNIASKNSSENTVLKNTAEESSADEAKSQKSQSEKDKSVNISENGSFTRSEQSQNSSGEKRLKKLPSINSKEKKKPSNISQQSYPSENKTFSNTRDSSSGSLTTLIRSHQNISLSEAETLRESKVQSEASGEKIFDQAIEIKEQSFTSSEPATSILKPNKAVSSSQKYDSNLRRFNEFLSAQQIFDEALASKQFAANQQNAQNDSSLATSTNEEQVLSGKGTELTNASFGRAVSSLKEANPGMQKQQSGLSEQNPTFQSARSDAMQPENNASLKARTDFSGQRLPFRIPFSETYLPEKDKLSARQLDKEKLLTKSFQRQYTDSELSVLTANGNFPTAPSANLSYDTYASASNQPNVRRYHLVDSGSSERSSNQIENEFRTQPPEEFSVPQSWNASSYYTPPQEQLQFLQPSNQTQVYNPSQSFGSKQETAYKDLRERLLSERAFESRMKSLQQQQQSESQSRYIQAASSPPVSLQGNTLSNEINPISSEVASRPYTINQSPAATQNQVSQYSRTYPMSFQAAGTPIASLQQNRTISNNLNRNPPTNQPRAASQRQILQYSTTGPEAYSPGVSKIGPQIKSSNVSSPLASKIAPQSYTSNQSRTAARGYPLAVSRVTTPFSSAIQSQPGFEVFSSATSGPKSQTFKSDQSTISPQNLSSGLSMPSSQSNSQSKSPTSGQINSFQLTTGGRPPFQIQSTAQSQGSSQTQPKDKTESQIYAGLSL